MPADAWEALPGALQTLVVWGAVAAAFTAVSIGAHRAWNTMIPLWRRVRAMHEIIERELTPNAGSSLRDQVMETALRTETIESRVGSINSDLQTMVAERDRDNAEFWQALGELGYDRRRRLE